MKKTEKKNTAPTKSSSNEKIESSKRSNDQKSPSRKEQSGTSGARDNH